MSDVPTTPPPEGGDDRAALSAYLDGEVDAEERLIVEARLVDSPEWRAELEDVRVARDALRALPVREAPAGFWERVTATVGAAPSEVPAADASEDTAAPVSSIHHARERRGARRRAIAWIAGAAAVAAAVGAMFVIPGRQSVRPNVTAVAVRHGATSAQDGDPISGLVPIAPGGSR